MKTGLLDVNVLLALAWPNHQHHAEAHDWFVREARHGWATTGFTQLGFIRLSSNPAYTTAAVPPREAASLLSSLQEHSKHRFWTSPPAANPTLYDRALGHQQVNDAYLIEVARHHRGQLVTFDRRLVAHDPSGRLVRVIEAGSSLD